MLTAKNANHLEKVLAPGQTLFSAEEPAEVAYLVREGVLIVSATSLNGREVITSIYFPGEICGGFAALTGSTHTGTARAPRKSSVVVEPIRSSQLLDAIGRDRDLYLKLLATQREKEIFKDKMLLGVVADTCEQRMASTLLWLARKNAECSEPSDRFLLSRQELADLIGTTMETVIRLLSRFRKQGMIAESKGSVSVNVAALQSIASAAA
jgi:CRP/FNR family transcriptional regulator